MLKNQCRLAFFRRFLCIRAKEKRSLGDIRQLCTKSLNKSILSTNAFGVRSSVKGAFCNLVQYTKEVRCASSETLNKSSSGLALELDPGAKTEHLQEDTLSVDNSLKLSWKQKFGYYLRLSKYRLTGLVVITTMAGYSLAPGEFSPSILALASLGTLLCSSSANTINQWLEVPFDSQMSRTKNRVLVRGLMSSTHALSYGLVAGVTGLTILSTQVNGLTAALGASTLLLYTTVYTPLKRLSIANTWVGSVVGALPPLMGWSACTGILNPGAFILGGVLYSWQFPHFNALSWNLRGDYSRAGYRMMSVLNPELCRKVTLRHCISLIALSTLLPISDVTTWWLAVDSLPLNAWFTLLAWRFYKRSDNKSARKLFRFSLIHLPLLMGLILFHKKYSFERGNDFEDIAEEKNILCAF